jgi:hypothetical protein
MQLEMRVGSQLFGQGAAADRRNKGMARFLLYLFHIEIGYNALLRYAGEGNENTTTFRYIEQFDAANEHGKRRVD